MRRFIVLVVATAAALVTACDDMFSLTPLEEVSSFEVQATLAVADEALSAHAKRNGLEVKRDPNPRQRTIPSDYSAMVADSDCLLTVQGVRSTKSADVRVWLGATERSSCEGKMSALFTGLRSDLQARDA